MWKPKPKLLILFLVVAVLAFVGGRYAGRDSEDRPEPAGEEHTEKHTEHKEKDEVWTCSMDPAVRQSEPGKCPVCGMDLILLQTDGADLGERTLRLSAGAAKLAEVQTSPVERRFAEVTIELAGRVEADEARVRQVSSWTAGRIERLFVDYTGVPVKAGEHLVEIYSPELYAAQEELLEAQRAVLRLQGGNEFALKAIKETAQASRDKLRLLGFDEKRLTKIEKTGKAQAVVEVFSPAGGVVIEKLAREGMYVRTGTPLYTVADLSKVWVILDAYESDLAFLRLGQQVETRTEAYGDEVFAGRISFVSPTLDPVTRTTRIRIILDNPGGRLRPGMLTRSTIQVRLGTKSMVVSDEFRGKWACPMHPEEVGEEQGTCRVCGMPLVPSERLGYADPGEAKQPLLVPASAVLTTGRRAVVYVREANDDSLYTAVDIQLGPRAGEFYIVADGLKGGQEVVTRGAFKLDSELQIQGKTSMMAARAEPKAAAEKPTGGPVPQKTCPIMGGAIDRKLYTDVRGQRIYVCCPGCQEPIEKNPEAALAKLHERGEYAESLQKTCPIMGGEISPELFVEYLGRRIYVCCEGCLDPIRKDPAKYADMVAKPEQAKP